MEAAQLKKALERITALTRQRILTAFPNRVDTCLPSCMVLSEILTALRFSHKLYPVACQVRNSKKGDEAYGVGITKHLVVIIGNAMLVDPSIDQASRPEHSINLTPLVWEAPYMDWLMEQGVSIAHCACMVKYQQIPPWHLTAPDFTKPSVKEIVIDDAIWVVDQLKAEGIVKDHVP